MLGSGCRALLRQRGEDRGAIITVRDAFFPGLKKRLRVRPETRMKRKFEVQPDFSQPRTEVPDPQDMKRVGVLGKLPSRHRRNRQTCGADHKSTSCVLTVREYFDFCRITPFMERDLKVSTRLNFQV